VREARTEEEAETEEAEKEACMSSVGLRKKDRQGYRERHTLTTQSSTRTRKA
jgi:hypothetical protein